MLVISSSAPEAEVSVRTAKALEAALWQLDTKDYGSLRQPPKEFDFRESARYRVAFQRAYLRRCLEFWSHAEGAGLLPDFGVNPAELLLLAFSEGQRPAETVVAVLRRFGPEDYDLKPLIGLFGAFVRAEWVESEGLSA